ncbi:MAG: DNA polymerase III subunit delta [Deltaproteobacteria bacterium]|nr:MAG: DNA polymerase III subunit delta [Deltaproteobacteria bacterium]
MRGQDLLRKFEQAEIKPIYFFYGKEGLLIEEAVAIITRKFLPGINGGSSKISGLEVVYGREGEAERIINLAQTLPMFSPRKVILVKEADKLSPKDLEKLITYLENPSPTTCLIFWGEKADLRTKFFRTFKKFGVLTEFRNLYESELPAWIRQFAQKSEKGIEREAVDLLIESVGNDLRMVKHELEKVMTYIGAKKTIELEDIEAVVVLARIRTVFELTDWLGNKNVEKAWEALTRIWEEGEHPLRILTMIARQFRFIWKTKQMLARGLAHSEILSRLKTQPFLLDRYLEQAKKFSFEELRKCFEEFYQVDLRLKSSKVPPRIILEKLVVDLCR